MPASTQHSHFFRLPAELRINILEYVFAANSSRTGLITRRESQALVVDPDYHTNVHLSPLLVCRQWYHDTQPLALQYTSFVITSLFCDIPGQLTTRLHPRQIQAIRSITYVADARHFRKLVFWGTRPFGLEDLRLDSLTIVLHRSSAWHYLFDYTSDVTQLLRDLQGVKRFTFIRNDARVKGSFKTWYNRLIGLIMKVDHRERYEKQPPNPEVVWWKWHFHEPEQKFCLEPRPPKPLVAEEEYMESMAPLMTELMHSIESEEWNPDPRARLMYY